MLSILLLFAHAGRAIYFHITLGCDMLMYHPMECICSFSIIYLIYVIYFLFRLLLYLLILSFSLSIEMFFSITSSPIYLEHFFSGTNHFMLILS
jgi:hypothetical protein